MSSEQDSVSTTAEFIMLGIMCGIIVFLVNYAYGFLMTLFNTWHLVERGVFPLPL